MRALKLAVKSQRWDLAAHTIVLGMAKQLNNGGKPNAKEKREKSRRTKG